MNQQIMWHVPQIQFVMDDTSMQVCQVEELLKVADMGPDFEPTPLGSSMKPEPTVAHDFIQRKTTDCSGQSDVDNLRAVPGPGGSVELVMSKTKDHTQSFAEHSQTWNGGSADMLPPDTAEESTGEKLDNNNTVCEEMSSDDDDETFTAHASVNKYCRSRSRKVSEADGFNTAKSTSEVRSDIYGLDHARLWQQVLHAKRKSANRSYRPSDELIAELSVAAASDTAKKGFTHSIVVRSKMRRRDRKERPCRNPEYLSCHYHNSVEDLD